MATSSLEQSFEIDDEEVANAFFYDLENPEVVVVPKIDRELEEQQAARLLQIRFSSTD